MTSTSKLDMCEQYLLKVY